MTDLETMCADANARLRQSIAKSAGQHLRHFRALVERVKQEAAKN